MSARELVLRPSNGAITTLAFTETSLTVSYEWTSATVPIRNVIAATASGSAVKVSYLFSNGKYFSMRDVQGEVLEEDVPKAAEWCSSITQVAYEGRNPSKVLKVLVNPHGGPGRARQIFERQVEPILRAAGCTLDVTITTRAGHATEIAQNMELTYDALVIVSGDGLIHEVMNGLSRHASPEKAFCIPIAPIPAGSGNGLSLNILGIHDGLDACAAALNVLKGRPMKVDLFSFAQGNQRRISFMSQSVGLMADVDIDTEHLRWMGDLRFIWGFLRAIITRKTCRMELCIKVVEQDKSQMVDALHARRESAAKGVPPADIIRSDQKEVDGSESPEGWVKFDEPILFMFAGKGPYVSRSLMQFPVSQPDDGLIDISIQDIVGRKFLLSAMDGAEVGRSYWWTSNRYFKASAYRAKPHTASGVVMVDGEAFPFEEFQVEVLPRLGTLLSPYPYYAADFDVIDAKGTRRETT